MATRLMYKALSIAALGVALSLSLAATTTASSATSKTAALPVSDQTSTVQDPVGDTYFPAPAFQDIVLSQLTKTAAGDFVLLMTMAGPVPVAPSLPPPGVREIWWYWGFDFDPTADPQGYPYPHPVGVRPEILVVVSWTGTTFAGTAIDRRPLLTGGEAIITPLTFSIDGTMVQAVLPSELIGDAPASFHWGPGTRDWAGPVGSNGNSQVDAAETVFGP